MWRWKLLEDVWWLTGFIHVFDGVLTSVEVLLMTHPLSFHNEILSFQPFLLIVTAVIQTA